MTGQRVLVELSEIARQRLRLRPQHHFRVFRQPLRLLTCQEFARSFIPPAPRANARSVAGSDSRYRLPGADPAGFWSGLWHGIIASITFLVGLFAPGAATNPPLS